MSFQQRLDTIRRLANLRDQLSDAVKRQENVLANEVYNTFMAFLRARLGLFPHEPLGAWVSVSAEGDLISIRLHEVGAPLGHCRLLGSRPLCWLSAPFRVPLVEIERALAEFRRENLLVYYILPPSQAFSELSLDLIETSLFQYKVTPLRVGLQRLKTEAEEATVKYFLLQVNDWKEIWLEYPKEAWEAQPPVARIVEGSVGFESRFLALETQQLPL